MPRHALANVSIAALHAEINRRKSRLAKMIAERDALNKEIAALEGLAGGTPARKKPGPKPRKKPGPKPGNKLGRKTRRKPGPKPAKAPATPKKARKRGSFKVSAEQMILDLLKNGKTLSTTDIGAAWQKAGRAGSASATLGKLVTDGKVKREVVKGSRANNYTLA